MNTGIRRVGLAILVLFIGLAAQLTYLQVIERSLRVMDSTAITLCMENKLPIVVFNLRQPGNLKRVVMGEPVGTTVSA